ncbi:hypothetical protein KY290_021375 [Solanum tuberosum]|uniref:Uncharacterized protein n=1 Tax=Solanum tuberosum TaxID=4113 RepID=A0ABQ7V3E4_SOLTU|nr:hypothetical protein KY290_021375 [Solanum tuberosum]
MRKKPPVPIAQKFPHADPLALRLLERMLEINHLQRRLWLIRTSVVCRMWTVNHLLIQYQSLSLNLSRESWQKMLESSFIERMCIALLLNSSHFSLLLTTTHVQGISITQENSLLNNTVRIEGLLAGFPMFDWVGKRTSEMSAVGLLPAALQGIYIREMLVGAALMDEANRTTVDMVVLPYKDSLLLFSRYLQYLVMESPGKEFDLDVLCDRPPGHDWDLEPGVTFGDYLFGMLQGTRSALYSNDRESITVTVQENAGN